MERCPECGTELSVVTGIGPVCPKKSCRVSDDAALWDGNGNKQDSTVINLAEGDKTDEKRDYKVLFVPKTGDAGQWEKEYATHAEAEIALNAISLYTLSLHDNQLMPDYSNFGMVLMRDDNDIWIEINGDDGEME